MLPGREVNRSHKISAEFKNVLSTTSTLLDVLW
jgi:hypothetical protein